MGRSCRVVLVPRLVGFSFSLLCLLVLALVPTPARAVPARPGVISLRQPDGTRLLARLHGDEFYSWAETVNGQTVARDPRTGFWRPAARPLPPPNLRSLHAAASRRSVLVSGVGNIPVILINFANTTTSFTTGDVDKALFGTGSTMAGFYKENSYGQFTVSAGPGGVVGWYTAAHDHDYYGYDQGFAVSGELVKEAVEAADAAGFNFGPL